MTSADYPTKDSVWPDDSNFIFLKGIEEICAHVSEHSLWELIKKGPPEGKGFMLWSHPDVNKLYDIADDNGHSGMSSAFLLRHVQYIARHGFDAWKDYRRPKPKVKPKTTKHKAKIRKVKRKK